VYLTFMVKSIVAETSKVALELGNDRNCALASNVSHWLG
jgi:hypothetical protein